MMHTVPVFPLNLPDLCCRFREIYYWDSFWIIRGLLLCGMYDTVKGMLLNFVHLIKDHGMIPNGGRTYYLNRQTYPNFGIDTN